MDNYLKNFARKTALFEEKTLDNLQLCVVIPCFNEPEALQTLQSIKKCDLPPCGVEVLIIINDGENASENIKQQNLHTFNQLNEFAQKNNSENLKFLIHYEKNIPKKLAGVGFARKLGMDEAVRRLNHPNGIIACLDTDCTVSKNYLTEIYHNFLPENFNTATIYFEHPVKGNDYPDEIYQAAYHYELHLRYYKNALAYAGFPFAIYTVGSSMAVKANAYCKQGGMNKRKAGEDFYFLPKMCKLSKPVEINSCAVFPSPRISNRVPFGTGKAIGEIISSETPATYLTYAFRSFSDLKVLFENIENLYNNLPVQLPDSITAFLSEIEFEQELNEIRNNSTDYTSFYKRFFQWFNAFRILKFIHFARDNFYPNQPVEQETKKLLSEMKAVLDENQDLLLFLRNNDRLHSET